MPLKVHVPCDFELWTLLFEINEIFLFIIHYNLHINYSVCATMIIFAKGH